MREWTTWHNNHAHGSSKKMFLEKMLPTLARYFIYRLTPDQLQQLVYNLFLRTSNNNLKIVEVGLRTQLLYKKPANLTLV